MAMDLDELIRTLKLVVVEELAKDRTVDQIGDDEALTGGGLNLDSMNIITLIELVEAKFYFRFEDADLRPATFENLRTLAEAICKRTDA